MADNEGNEKIEEFTNALEAIAEEEAPAKEESDEPKSPDDDEADVKEDGETTPVDDSESDKGGESEEEPEDDGLDEALVKRAAELDISEDELKELGDNAEAMVDRMAKLYDRKVAELGRKIAEKKPSEDDSDSGKDKAPDGQGSRDVVKMLLDSGYEEDEPVVQAVKLLSEQNAALQEKLSTAPAAQDSGSAQDQQAIIKEVETFFDSVPKEYQSLVGKGHDLKPDSSEYKLRQEILDTAAAMDIGYQAQGKMVEIKDLLQKAFALNTTDKAKEIARKELAAKMKKRSRSALTSPNKSNARELPTSDDDAVSELAGIMKEHGLGSY